MVKRWVCAICKTEFPNLEDCTAHVYGHRERLRSVDEVVIREPRPPHRVTRKLVPVQGVLV